MIYHQILAFFQMIFKNDFMASVFNLVYIIGIPAHRSMIVQVFFSGNYFVGHVFYLQLSVSRIFTVISAHH